MKKTYYYPRTDGKLIIWLKNLKEKIVIYGKDLGLSEDDIKEATARCDGGTDQINKQLQMKATMQKQSKDKKQYLKTSKEILTARINSMKANSNYTPAIGEDMRIVGDEQTFNPDELQPIIKEGVHTAGGTVVKWSKGFADGINFYLDKRDGQGFLPHGTDMEPDWLLTVPLPEGKNAIIVDLLGVYIIGDEEVGKKSEAIQITLP